MPIENGKTKGENGIMKKLSLAVSAALVSGCFVMPAGAEEGLKITNFDANTQNIILTLSNETNDDIFEGTVILKKQNVEQTTTASISADKKNIVIIPSGGIEPGVRYTLSVSGDELTQIYDKTFCVKTLEYATVPAMGGKGWGASAKSSDKYAYNELETEGEIIGYDITVSEGEPNFILYPKGAWAWNICCSAFGRQDYTFSFDVTPKSDEFDFVTMMRADDQRWWINFPSEPGYTTYPNEIMLRSKNTINILGNNVNGIYDNKWNTGSVDESNILTKDTKTNITMVVKGDNLKVYIGGNKVFDETTECIQPGLPGFGINTGTSVKLENMTATYVEKVSDVYIRSIEGSDGIYTVEEDSVKKEKIYSVIITKNKMEAYK